MTTSVLYEIAETLQAARLKLPIDLTLDFTDLIATVSEFVPIRGLDRGCRDEDDDRLVETAVNGRAAFLVTRDRDILADPHVVAELAKRHCNVVTVDEFAMMLPYSEPEPLG